MLQPILRALGRAVRRDLGTFGSLTANNFSLFVALMIYGCLVSGVAPRSSYPFLLLLGFLLLFPLSSDPLAKIPAPRLALWPLGAQQRFTLRLISLFLSPVLWVTVALLLKTASSLAAWFLALAIAMQAGVLFWRRAISPQPWAPPMPGKLGPLVRMNLRQMFSVLDVYLALILSVGGTLYRLTDAAADPAAFPILAMIVGLALSTYSQCLFSLDGAAGIARYSLMPLRGWQILMAKDAAFMIVLLVLVAPLDLAAGAAFGITALAIGHWPSVRARLPLRRWRFCGGRVKYGVTQAVLGTVLAMDARRAGLPLAVAAYAVSLYLCRDVRSTASAPTAHSSESYSDSARFGQTAGS